MSGNTGSKNAPQGESHALFPVVDPQNQSPFFNLLAPELRRIIYKEALSRPRRLMHITTVGEWRVWWAHRFCDEEAEAPSKASCRCSVVHGERQSKLHMGDVNVREYIPAKRDAFLDFLRTCLRIYHEGRDVLYGCNVFSFGSNTFAEADCTPFLPLYTLHKMAPPLAWNAIRHIHLDAAFQMWDKKDAQIYNGTQWDPYRPVWKVWTELPEVLEGMQLSTLHIDIFFAYWKYGRSVESVHDETCRHVLQPLRNMAAKYFTVTLNIKMSEAIEKEFEDANFKAMFVKPVKERVYPPEYDDPPPSLPPSPEPSQ